MRTEYLSPDGLVRARAELDDLVKVKRLDVAEKIKLAREHGDLSENAEYEDAKNEQAFVEGRVQTLQLLIKNARIIEPKAVTGKVGLGSIVTIDGEDGPETYTIVGRAEAQPTAGRISNESPLGRALLGRSVGDKISYTAPGGEFKYDIATVA
jgi:transcription elongation factor GreA